MFDTTLVAALLGSSVPQGPPEMTDDQRQEAQEAFDLFDSEKTGTIDYHELKVRAGSPIDARSDRPLAAEHAVSTTVLRVFRDVFTSPIVVFYRSNPFHFPRQVCLRALGFQVTKEEVKHMMEEYDVENKGEIDFDAFMAISAYEMLPCRIPMGWLTRGTMSHGGDLSFRCAVRKKYAERDPDEEIRRAFELFDEDQKGTISLRVRITETCDKDASLRWKWSDPDRFFLYIFSRRTCAASRANWGKTSRRMSYECVGDGSRPAVEPKFCLAFSIRRSSACCGRQ